MKQDSDNKDKAFQMRVSEAFLRKVDDWRVKLRPVPSRAEAIRMLVDLGVTVKVRKD